MITYFRIVSIISVLATPAVAQNAKIATAKAKATAPIADKPVAAETPAKAAWPLQLGAYGGYSIALINSATTTTTVGSTSVETKTTATTDLGGLYGGADILYGEKFQYGLGVTYMQTSTASGAASAILPVTLRARYMVLPQIYGGVNAGYAFFIGQKVEGYTYLDIPVGAELGYQFNLGSVLLDAGLQMTYTIVSRKATDVSISGGTFFLTPYVRLGYNF